MPCVNVQLTAGITRDQKQQLVAEITDLLGRLLGKRPEHTHIIIQEIAEENWGYCGMLTDEFRSKAE